jgi:hypothetical protein
MCKKKSVTVSDLCAWAFARGVEGIGKAFYQETYKFPTVKDARAFKRQASTVANAKAHFLKPGSTTVVVVIKAEDG